MDREEARELLLGCSRFINEETDLWEALDLAIEALKGDFHCPKCGTIVRDGRQYHDLVYRGEAEPTRDEGVAESATTTDCISRQQAIEALTGWETEPLDEDVVRTLNNLPPVNQKQITGKLESAETATSEGEESTMGQPKWIEHELWDVPWFTCSECNFHGRSDFKFCPNCGAKMCKGGDE